jgi:ATP-binding cassette subfamily B protein RaxB
MPGDDRRLPWPASEITELRRRLSVSVKGANLKHLVGMAERLGFAARPVRLELDELRQLSTPCILHWDLNHFVVLAKVTRDALVIHDPAVGVRRLPMATVSRHFTGVALELTPVANWPRTERRAFACARYWHVVLRARSDSCSPSPGDRGVRGREPAVHAVGGRPCVGRADRDLLLVLALGFGMLLLLRTMVSAMRGWMVIVLAPRCRCRAGPTFSAT